ncbi:unannotated protein [freshwater metagenome]|uniref:Unannotated protein n=1 Tax=freshwater metagenome TaxID=449393 RepID=A0A6J7CV81_9ZZZZ|nr:metallophosphoesterase [Actinomycetota bacterium]
MWGMLYDVHGNLPALEAVLAEARPLKVDSWLLGGDFTLFGGWPVETLALLRSLPDATWIRGNGERWTAAPHAAPPDENVRAAIAHTAAALGNEEVAALAALPAGAPVPGGHAWHASPVSDVQGFLPEPEPQDADLLANVDDARLVVGHTHMPFLRVAEPQGIEILNPGSVGMPFDGNPRAAWALVHDDGTVELRRTRYDHAAAARRVREAADGARWGEITAQRIERARFVTR